MFGLRATRAWCSLTLLVLSGCASSLDREHVSITWHRIESPTTASLRGVRVLDNGVVWVSGSNGTILRSTDHGRSWSTRTSPSANADFRDIEARDADTAWAMAITEPAQLHHTTNGGESWAVVYESDPEASFFDSVALFENGGGILFGDPRDGAFEIVTSEDGIRWAPVPTRVPVAQEGEAAFAASGTCVVTHGDRHAWIGTGGAAVRVLRSSDRGRTWQAVEAPFPQGGSVTGIYSVHFVDDRRGVIVGGAYTKPDQAERNAAWTQDGGATWHPPTAGLSGYRSSVTSIVGPNTATPILLAVGKGGADYSIDGGRTWRALTIAEGYYAIDASADGTIIAVGKDGRMARVEVEIGIPTSAGTGLVVQKSEWPGVGDGGSTEPSRSVASQLPGAPRS